MPLSIPGLSRRSLYRTFLLIAGLTLLPVIHAQTNPQASEFHLPHAPMPAQPHTQAHFRLSQSPVPFVTPDASETTPNFGGFYAAPYFNSENVDTIATLTGDFNHDGKPDIVTVCNTSQVSVLLNNGAGGFEAPVITDFIAPYQNYEAASAIVADLNGDGYDDIVIGNKSNSSLTDSVVLVVLINQKNGTFGKPILLYGPDAQITTGGRVNTYTFGVAKTTSSGHEDIVIAEDYQSSSGYETLIQTSLNNGLGTFSYKPMQVIADTPQNVYTYNLTTAFADVNHDGKVDLLLEKDSEGGSGTYEYVFVMTGNADGTFQVTTPKSTLLFPAPEVNNTTSSILLARSLTSDPSKIDLLLNCIGGTYVALSNGDGTYQAPKLILNSKEVIQILTADVNGDGKPDLVTVGSGVLTTYLGNGDGTFSAIKGTAVAFSEVGYGSLESTVTADFNQDGKVDFANGNIVGYVELGLGNGDGTFQTTPILFTANFPQAIASIEAAPDLNGDSIPDLIAWNYGSLISAVSNGRGGFTYQTALPESAYPLAFLQSTVGDFNGDGKQDVVLASNYLDGDNTAAVALSNGDGTLRTPISIIQPPMPLACSLYHSAAGDLNGDGKLDLVFAYSGDSNCSSGSTVPPGYLIALGNGNGTFKTTFLPATNGLPIAIALGHFHGNSSPLDLVATLFDETTDKGTTYILKGNGNGSFGAPVQVSSQLIQVYQILTDDFNQDGKADLTLIGYSDTTYTAGAFLLSGNGNGTFTQFASLVPPTAFVTVSDNAGTYADVNGDGVPDLIDVVDYGFLSVYLGTGHGNFATQINYFLDTIGGPIVAGRFHGGNALDILAPTPCCGGTALLMNLGGSILTAKASATSIVAGQSFTLSSTLTATLISQPEPTGTITFYDGATQIGSTSVDGSFSTAKLAVGAHTITAKYPGDAHFNPNAAAPVSVTVVAAVASIQVSPTSIAFPNTTVGTTSAAHTVTIKNAGNTTVTFSSIKPGGTNYAEFLTTTTTCASTLAPGASCTASVAYKPQNPGAASATYNVSDNIAGSPQKVTLSGTGVAPLTISVSPASLTFPTTKVGATSPAQTVTVKNTGTAAVTFSSIKPGGTNYAEFLTTATTCGASLAGGASCTASVAFRPQATGAASATYNASDNALNSPQRVTLTGSAD